MSDDVHGEIAKAMLRAARGDTLEWDFATEDERETMRAVAAEFEPIFRRAADGMAAWLEGVDS